MKYIFFISGIMSSIMSVLLLTNVIELHPRMKEIIENGNSFYNNQEYDKAKEQYLLGQAIEPKNKILRYNLGLVDYATESYAEAIDKFNKSEDTDMILGNTYYRMGTKEEDVEKQLDFYEQAIDMYLKGMKKDPWSDSIKFNYEFVKKLIEDIEEQQKQDKQNQQDQGEDDPNNQENNGGGGSNNQENNGGGDPKNQENNGGGDPKNQENNGGQDPNNQENDPNNQGNNGGNDPNNQGKNQGGEDTNNGSNQGQIGDETEEEGQGVNPNRQEIEHILLILEQQEKDSFKRNQPGGDDYWDDDEYEW